MKAIILIRYKIEKRKTIKIFEKEFVKIIKINVK